MKLLALGAALVGALCLVVALFLMRPESGDALSGGRAALDPTTRPEPPVAAPAAIAPSADEPVAPAPEPELDSARVEVEAPTIEASATHGELRVRARWQDGGGPAEGCVVVARNYAQGLAHPQELVARTDAEGFALLHDVLPGFVRVGLLRGESLQAVVRAGETSEVELTLPRGVELEVEVEDELGRPVANAGIWLSDGRRLDEGHVVAHTDALGHVTVRAVREGQFVGARAAGYLPSYLIDPPGEVGARVPVRLVLASRAAPLTGRVTDASGGPIANADVLVGDEEVSFDKRLDSGLYTPGSPPSRARTDADGRFRVESAPHGTPPLQVRAAGFGPFRGAAEVLPQVGGEVEVVLAREARVYGRVLDEHGEPSARARVETLRLGRFASAFAYSAPDGSYELPGLPAGEVTLRASHEEHGQRELELELEAGERREWEARLVPALRVHGRVVDELGNACVRFPVALFDRAQGPGDWKGTVTRTDGAFSFEGLEERDYTLTVNDAGGLGGFPRVQLEGVRPGGAALELVVDSAGRDVARVTGTVLGPGGLPAQGVVVSLTHVDQKQNRRFAPDAASGRFEALVPPGHVTLRVRGDEHPWSALITLELEAGEVRELDPIELSPATRLVGSVSGIADEHLASLTLALINDRGGEGGVVTATGREFKSGPVEAGSYTLFVQGDYVVAQRVEVELEEGVEKRLELHLERAGQRVVRLVPPPVAGQPPHLWCVVLDGNGGQAWMRGNLPFEDGAYVARVSVAPGSYRVVARDSNGLAAEGELVVSGVSGEQPALELPLRAEQDD